jgi:hypothetical protein
MDAMAVFGGRRAVGGGSDKWVCELHAPTQLQQTRVHCSVGRGHVDAERFGGTVQQQRIAQWFRGRGEHQQLRLGGEQVETSDVVLFDLADDWLAVRQPEPAGEVCHVPAARKLKQRKRIAVALGDDLEADSRIERPVQIAQ